MQEKINEDKKKGSGRRKMMGRNRGN